MIEKLLSDNDIVNLRYKDKQRILFKDKDGLIRKGTVRIKKVTCNKPRCSKCPHSSYAYAQYRVGKKVTEKYLGVAR